MQNTRLNAIINLAGYRLVNLFRNPWRHLAVVAISLLFGFFLGGSALSSTAGQLAYWDAPAAAIVVLLVELINRLVYRRQRNVTGELTRSKLFSEVLNAFKIGVTYGLFLEAFKLNS